jgi:Bacterial PH domain
MTGQTRGLIQRTFDRADVLRRPLLVLVAFLFAGSLLLEIGYGASRSDVIIMQGAIWYLEYPTNAIDKTGFFALRAGEVRVQWRPMAGKVPQGYVCAIPLWLIVAILLIPWRRKATRESLERAGRCVRCEYDLTGNRSGTCPECGTTIQPLMTIDDALASSPFVGSWGLFYIGVASILLAIYLIAFAVGATDARILPWMRDEPNPETKSLYVGLLVSMGGSFLMWLRRARLVLTEEAVQYRTIFGTHTIPWQEFRQVKYDRAQETLHIWANNRKYAIPIPLLSKGKKAVLARIFHQGL